MGDKYCAMVVVLTRIHADNKILKVGLLGGSLKKGDGIAAITKLKVACRDAIVCSARSQYGSDYSDYVGQH